MGIEVLMKCPMAVLNKSKQINENEYIALSQRLASDSCRCFCMAEAFLRVYRNFC